MKSQQFKSWDLATQKLADEFNARYFGPDASDVYWIASEIGGCLAINDYFFSLRDICEFIRHSYSKKDMFAYYDYSLTRFTKGVPIACIRDWRKMVK